MGAWQQGDGAHVSDKPASRLALHIARAVDDWRATHDSLTALEVLEALEEVRFRLTEAVVRGKMERT
mgnify:FL=1